MSFKNEVRDRKQLLEELVKKLESQQPPKVQGELRGSLHGKTYQYYLRESKSDKNGRYLPKRKMATAQALAQWEYREKLLEELRRELEMLTDLARNTELEPWNRAAQQLPLSKQLLLVKPYQSDEEYAAEWSSKEYPKKEISEDASVLETKRGELVRSKSEVLIADALYAEGIPYHYEKPLRIRKLGTIHPDFTILDVKQRREIIWEHLGKMDDYDYRSDAFYRLRCYEEDGFYIGDNMILTFETMKMPLNPRTVRNMIQSIFLN